MGKTSLTITSLFVLVAVYLFQAAGIEIGEGEVQTTIEVIIKAISVIGIYIGRIRKGDLTAFGRRK